MTGWLRTGIGVALACIALAAIAVDRAIAAWPDDRPIEIIVGFQAGSGPDLLARRMANGEMVLLPPLTAASPRRSRSFHAALVSSIVAPTAAAHDAKGKAPVCLAILFSPNFPDHEPPLV